MVTHITNGIKISVMTNFEGTYNKDQGIHFAFSYYITIENHTKDTVQLLSRYWEIYDSLQTTETIEGIGVVGEKPIIKPGEIYTYTSGCLLSSPHGSMKGYFNMLNHSNSKIFKVQVPRFDLHTTFSLN